MRMGRDRAKRKTPPQDKNRSIVEPNRARGTESNSRAVNFSTDPGFLIIPDGHRTERDGQKAGVAFQGKQKRRRYPAKTHPPGSQSQHGTQPISGKNQFGHSAASGIPVKREGDKWKKNESNYCTRVLYLQWQRHSGKHHCSRELGMCTAVMAGDARSPSLKPRGPWWIGWGVMLTLICTPAM